MLHKVDVVVFDFDGTLSGSDSNWEFAKYCLRHSVRPWFFLPLMGIGLMARMFCPHRIWWRELARCYLTPKMVRDFVPQFVAEHKMRRFGWAAERVAAEKSAGRKVLLITASADYMIPSLVRDMKFDAVLTSEMDATRPWKYKFLCWGRNKVIAMDNWARKNKFIPRVVRAYSDSKSDMPIMEIAAEQVWINPKTGLRK